MIEKKITDTVRFHALVFAQGLMRPDHGVYDFVRAAKEIEEYLTGDTKPASDDSDIPF